MEIPSKVRIGSADYEVIVEDKILVLDSDQCKGKINFDYHKINIDSSFQDKQGQEQTFLHELIHGIIKERSLDLEKDDDETITEEIAVGLHQVIRDNPEIFFNYIKVGDIEFGSITTNEIAKKIANHQMCGQLLDGKQIMTPYFIKYNLCRNRETGKEYFYKSRNMDPIRVDIVSVEDIFATWTINVTDFKENYELV